MHLIFKNLKIFNFLSFSESELQFNNQGYVLVNGINNNKEDLAKSNGSGKSSLFEAIIWCLTGDTIRGTKEIVNRKFPDKGAYVELTFSIDKNEYKITRYKDYPKLGSNLKIIINGEDKSGKGIRDSEKLLEQYLPDLNAQLLGSVVILGQGLPQRFTNNTPSGRKEVLEKLSKSDFMIEDIKNKLISRKMELNGNLRKVEDSILADTSSKNVLESQLRKEEDEYKSIPFIDFDNDFAYYQINIERSENDLNLKEKHYENIFDETQKVKQEYLLLDTKLEEFKLKCANDHNEQASPLVKESFRLDYEINSLKKEIESYKNMKDVCPTCGQKLPDFHKVDTSEMEIKLDILIKERENNKKLIEDLKQKLNSKIEDYEKTISYEKNSIGEKQKTLTESCNLVTKEIADLKLNLNKLKSDFQNLQYLKEKLDNYSNHIEDLKNQINQFSEKILYYNIEKDKINSHIDVVSKMSTIATRDFRGFLLSEIINFINIRAKEYAKDIIESDKINFYLDGNNINITYCDKQYEGLSGGEKQKADLIIQFSIRDMLVKFLNFSSNILVLDEIFDALDSLGCDRVVNLISNRLNDIESVYVISHRVDSLAIPMDNEIIIVKDENGISKVN